MRIEYAARSHVGITRTNNEDNLYVDGVILTPDMRERPFAIDGSVRSAAVFAVCDGMGGEDNGETASLLAVQALSGAERRMKSAAPEWLGETVQAYVRGVCGAIQAVTESSGKRTGTTLALAAVSEKGIYCFNLGDSRIYGLQRSDFWQITNDHSLAAEQVSSGIITKEQAASIINGSKLTRCMGIGVSPNAESYAPLTGDCRILICSDGLSDLVSDSEIENILRMYARAANAADCLLKSALENGGNDNVTVIVLEVKDLKPSFFRSLVRKLKG